MSISDEAIEFAATVLRKLAQDLEESAQIIQVRSHDHGIDNEQAIHAMNTDAGVLRARADQLHPYRGQA